jgi:hypothetical protein
MEMNDETQLRELKRENRELKKYLLSVSTVVAQSVAVIDSIGNAPPTNSQWEQLGAVANTFEMTNDSMMHFGLKLDFDKMKRLKKKWEIFKAQRIKNENQTWLERRLTETRAETREADALIAETHFVDHRSVDASGLVHERQCHTAIAAAIRAAAGKE